METQDLSNLTLDEKNQERGILKTLGIGALPFIAGATAYYVADSCNLNAPFLGYIAFGIPVIYISEVVFNRKS